jgi:hypothetical protein
VVPPLPHLQSACGISQPVSTPIGWIGDKVREPIREEDLVILFTQSGKRKEIALIA